jgi:hypothetical protein
LRGVLFAALFIHAIESPPSENKYQSTLDLTTIRIANIDRHAYI